MHSRSLRRPATLVVLLVPLWLAGARGVALAPWAALVTPLLVGVIALAALRAGLRAHRFVPWLAALVGWAALDAVLRPVPAAQAAWLVAAGVVAVALAAVCATPAGTPWARRAVVALGAATAAWLVVERLLTAQRPAGPFGETNLAATVVALGLAVLPALRLRPVAALPAVAVLLAGVAASGSRAALLAAAGLAVVWLLHGRTRAVRGAAIVAVAVAVAGMAARVLLDRDPLRFERTKIWGVAARTVMAELPFGSGPGGYRDAALPHNFPRDGEFARYYRIPSLAESDPLQLAAVLGLPGLALAGVALVLLLREVGANTTALGVVVVVGVTSAFHTQLAVPIVAWVAAMAIGATLPRPRGPRLRLRPAMAASLVLLLAMPVAAALRWPERGLFPDGEALGELTRRALVEHRDDDGRLAAAEAAAWRSCRLRPRDPATWDALGDVRLLRATLRRDGGLAHAAAAAYEEARRADPLDVWAPFGEGRAYAMLGDSGRASSLLRVAVALEPNCVEGWLELGRLYLQTGEIGAAREALGRADAALRRAAGKAFVSGYERALAHADPVLLARLRGALARPS